jgi:hypothetical protein
MRRVKPKDGRLRCPGCGELLILHDGVEDPNQLSLDPTFGKMKEAELRHSHPEVWQEFQEDKDGPLP